MRRAAPSIAAAILAVTVLPAPCSAGWRSADRWHPDDEAVVEEPEPPRHDGMHGDGSQWDGDPHDRRGDRLQAPRGHHNRRHADQMPSTQPYWGTMRPYWNGPEPPGVIHRQPRTAPLKIPKQR